MKQMNPVAQIGVRASLLVSVLGPILALVLYPQANWLFAFALIGIALVVLQILTAKEPTPQEVAERAERILSGAYAAWDVDDYEHLNPKTPAVQDLWRSTMLVGAFANKILEKNGQRLIDTRAAFIVGDEQPLPESMN